jgi:hypothetical protein
LGCGLVGIVAIAACSGPNKTSGFSDTAPDNGSGGSDGGGDEAYLGSSGGPDLGDDGGATIPADAACASQTSKAQLKALDLYVMLDQSGSMKDPAGTSTKWDQVTSALTAFVGQASLAGVGVGIQYFGLAQGAASCPTSCTDDSQCNGGTCVPKLGKCACGSGGGTSSCDAPDYGNAEVEIAPLPGVAPMITASMSAHAPATDTPTLPALQGAINHATAWEQAHSDHVTVVIFATDGEPESNCDDNLADIDAVAAHGAGGTPKILTFVIGVGTSLTNLNGIAQAGGTGQAYLVDTGGNAQQQFLDALNKIRGQALGCVYTIPLPAAGGQIDYGKVNVQYTPGDGSPPITLPKVADKSSCPAGGDAWYYDNDAAPTQIVLCDTSCTKIAGDAKASIDIVTGCATVVR